MSTLNQKIIHLEEYSPRYFPQEVIPENLGIVLYDSYRNYINVEFPGIPTNLQWKLTALGYVGYIPISPELHIALDPKITLENLFQMLDVAYRLDIKFQNDLFSCKTLQDFYNRLARILAKKIMDRGRKGFYRSYVLYQDSLPYLREHFNLNSMIRSPWRVDLDCEYHEHTMDIEDNQILAWTLYSIARSGLCSLETLNIVRTAFHELDGYVTLQSFKPSDCIFRLYNRLNQDYLPLHSLSRFFLEQSGPGYQFGDHTMIPFLINMNRLFEVFVAEWLKTNLPKEWGIKEQEKVYLGLDNQLFFQLDLVLENNLNGVTRCVLDTKYKVAQTPSPEDIAQVIAYADALNCDQAFLVYPSAISEHIDVKPGHIRVRNAFFDLSADLDKAGQNFLQQILP